MDQQAQVVVPRVEVPGGGAGPIQVDPVGPHRVHDAPGVAQERREEQGRHEERREERQQQVPASHDARDRGRGLPAPAVREPGQGERQEHGAQRQGRRLLRGVHQAHASARQQGRGGAGFPQVAAGRDQCPEAEEDERGLVDVVPAVEDHGRGDRDEQGRNRGAGRAQEGPCPEVGGDESHPECRGDDAQGDLVDLDVASSRPGARRKAGSGSRGWARGTPQGRRRSPRPRAASRTCPRARPRRRASDAGRGPEGAGPRPAGSRRERPLSREEGSGSSPPAAG